MRNIFLLVSMFFLTVSVTAEQHGDFTYTDNGADITITGYFGAGGDITIPASINSKPVTSIGGNSAFSNCSNQISITIPDSVTTIGDNAFYACRSLISITIPDSVTTIGDNAFYGCLYLTSITIPDSVTTIGDNAFYTCGSLTGITIPASVSKIESKIFFGCSKLTSISVSPDNPSFSSEDGVLFNKGKTVIIICPPGRNSYALPDGVTSIGSGAFSGYSKLASISVGSGNPNYSSDGGVLFNKGKTLIVRYPPGRYGSYYVIPDGVDSIGDEAFSCCVSLNRIDIPNSVASIGNETFFNCHSLESINIPNNVTSIGNKAFSYCPGLLGTIVIPDRVTSIGNKAFYGCSGRTGIYIPASVTKIGEGAFGAVPMNYMFISPDNPSYSIDDGVLFDKGKTILIKCLVGKGGDYVIPGGVTSIEDGAFFRCSSLKSITIPEGVTNIGAGAFESCSGLASINIPSSVTSIDGAFYRCSSLKSITIPEGVTSIGWYTFQYCSSLTSITIPASVTSIGGEAFSWCSSLSSAYFEGNAPASFSWSVFDFTAPDFTIYYKSSNTGFDTPVWTIWNGYPCYPYDYNVVYDGNDKTSGTAPRKANYLANVTVTVTANSGNLAKTNYTFVGWNTQANGLGTNYTAETGTFTITANTTLYAKFAINTYSLTYTAGTGGTISGASHQTVSYGAAGTPVTAVPNTGYHFVNWGDNVMTAARTDTNVMSDIMVTASFAVNDPGTFTVTFLPSTGGVVNGTSPQNVTSGADCEPVTAVPETGYSFVNWTGSLVSTANPLTVKNANSDMTITANFAINTLKTGLVAYYPFNGNANDESGNGNNGTVNGATLTTNRFGNANSAYNFDGTNDYVWLGNNPSLRVPYISISAWFKANSDFNGAIYRWRWFGETFAIVNGIIDACVSTTGAGFVVESPEKYNDGKWHQALFTFNGGQLTLYVDGDEVGRTLKDPPGTAYYCDGGAAIGRDGDFSGAYFKGLIDDVRIYSRALSDSEAVELYAQEKPYTVNFTAGAGGTLAGTASQLVEYQGVCTAVIAVPNTGYHFVNWTGSTSTDNPLTVTNVTADMAITANFAINTLDTGLVAYYPFNGNANDESGNGNNGTVNGATLTNDRFGNANSAYSFNGGSVISVKHSPSIDLKNEFTISAWVTASGGKAVKQRQILWYGDGRNGYDPYFLYYSANSTDTNPVFGISFDGYNGYRNSLEETISNGYGRLTLMTGTCRKNADGSKTLSMYIDGQLSHDYLVPASTSQISYDTSQMWMTIGACQDPYWQQFVGTIDDIRIYNRALSESEAVELYVQKRPYTVNFAAGTGGTLNGEANQIVGYHSDCTPVIAVPNPGYHFVNWTGTGGYTSTTPSIAVTNITLEMSFTATFAVDVGTYYISGTVSGAVQQGVTLTLSGAASSKITSGADGAFTFTASNGSYTVTPSLSGYTFTPSSRNIAISGKDVNGCDFVATKNTGIYSISGTVGGAIQEGVTITLSDALSSTTLSGADGKYSFTGLADGDYTVTPELSVYSFTPFSKDATITGADQLDVNFTATTMSIYGTISKSSFNASHKESAKKINGTNVQYSTDKFTIQATIQLPEAFDLTAIGEDTGFTFDFGFYSFSDILGNATKKKLNGAKGGSATFKITGDDKIKGKTITVEKVDLRWDKKKKLTIKITGTPISNSNTNVLDLSGSGDSTSITGKIDTFTLTFNSAGAGFDKVLPLLAFTGKKKTSYVKGNVSMKTFTLVNWSAKGKK